MYIWRLHSFRNIDTCNATLSLDRQIHALVYFRVDVRAAIVTYHQIKEHLECVTGGLTTAQQRAAIHKQASLLLYYLLWAYSAAAVAAGPWWLDWCRPVDEIKSHQNLFASVLSSTLGFSGWHGTHESVALYPLTHTHTHTHRSNMIISETHCLTSENLIWCL